MSAQDFRDQYQDYLRQTSDLKLPEGNHVRSFSIFAEEALELLREQWPVDAEFWVHAMRLRRNGALSTAQWREVQDQLSSYRTSLGEPHGMNEPRGNQAALSFLFALAIESPEIATQACEGSSLVYLVDEFSSEFINHFGHGPALVDALKRAFHCESA